MLLQMAEFCSFLWLSNDGHLGCFYILAVVSSAALNIGVETLIFNIQQSLWNLL